MSTPPEKLGQPINPVESLTVPTPGTEIYTLLANGMAPDALAQSLKDTYAGRADVDVSASQSGEVVLTYSGEYDTVGLETDTDNGMPPTYRRSMDVRVTITDGGISLIQMRDAGVSVQGVAMSEAAIAYEPYAERGPGAGYLSQDERGRNYVVIGALSQMADIGVTTTDGTAPATESFGYTYTRDPDGKLVQGEAVDHSLHPATQDVLDVINGLYPGESTPERVAELLARATELQAAGRKDIIVGPLDEKGRVAVVAFVYAAGYVLPYKLIVDTTNGRSLYYYRSSSRFVAEPGERKKYEEQEWPHASTYSYDAEGRVAQRATQYIDQSPMLLGTLGVDEEAPSRPVVVQETQTYHYTTITLDDGTAYEVASMSKRITEHKPDEEDEWHQTVETSFDFERDVLNALTLDPSHTGSVQGQRVQDIRDANHAQLPEKVDGEEFIREFSVGFPAKQKLVLVLGVERNQGGDLALVKRSATVTDIE